MSVIKISKGKKICVSLLSLLFIFLGYYLAVYKSFGYKSYNFIIGCVIMNLSIGLFPMLWLNISLEDRSRRNLYVFPMVVISMLILLLIYFKQQEVLEEEIKSYGLTTYGKVIGFEVGFGRSRTKYATFTYTFENKQYIHRIKNYNKQYHLNQSLTLLISKRNPEIFKIMGTNE